MAALNTSLLDCALLEPIVLRRASRRARALTSAARARMTPWVEAARARHVVALELRDRKTHGVALGLLREAAFYALCALLAESASATIPTSAAGAWRSFDQLPGSSEAPLCVHRARSILAAEEPLAVDLLAPSAVEELRPAAEETVTFLLGLAEIQTPERLTLLRRLRIALLALGVAVTAFALLAYCVALAALSSPAH